MAPQLITLANLNDSTGEYPYGALSMDANGDLFGTAHEGGGADNDGTVFELSDTGGTYASTATTLASFDGTDGSDPEGNLIFDSDGDLLTTTAQGGAYSSGTVVEIRNTGTGYSSTPQIISSLGALQGSYTNGVAVYDGLYADAQGDLFSLTSYAGAHGDGTVFEISKTPSGYESSPIFWVEFTGTEADGSQTTLIADANGDLFGTSAAGGTNGTLGYNGGTTGDGTVFEVVKTANGYASTPLVLADFTGANGKSPAGPLAMDANGDLFGTANTGGTNNDGTIFEIPKIANGYGSLTTLVDFDGSDGAAPLGGVIVDADGNLFGTTAAGGPNGEGTVFELAATGSSYASAPTILATFDRNSTGAYPHANVIPDAHGDLFGTTGFGGTNDDGTIFEITNSGYVVASNSISWNGGTGSWNVAGDWSPTVVPASDDNVFITAAASNVVNSNVNNAALTLTLSASSTLDIGPSTTFTLASAGPSGSTLVNGGTIDVADGAELLAAGTLDDAGTIALSGTADRTALAITGNVTLQGGGTLTMSDSPDNAISSNGSAATLDNQDDISGAGTIGTDDGTLTVNNESGGAIDATGTTPLLIETGNAVTNEGALKVQDGGTLDVLDAVTGMGNASIATGRLELANSFSQDVNFTPGDAGTLEIDQTSQFGGTIYGLGPGDIIDLKNIAYDSAGTVSVEPDANNVYDILKVVENGTTSTFDLDPGQDFEGYDFQLSPDTAHGGTDVTLGGVYWIDTAGGDWSTGADWSIGAIPGATQTAFISLAGASPYTVTVSAPESIGALVVNSPNATLDIGTGGTLDVAGVVNLNGEPASLAALSIGGGGVLSSGSGDVDNGSGATKVMIDGAASQWTMTGQLIVGLLGATTGPSITISDGANLTTSTAAQASYNSTYDRLHSGSSMTLTSGGSFDDVWLWCEAGSALSLASGTTMTLRGVSTTDSEWNLTVDGTAALDDATLSSAAGAISIGGNNGGAETGSLSASAGSQVTSLITRLAWGAGTTGSLTLTGTGTSWSDGATPGGPADSGSSYIGASGQGTLVIEAGATMSEAGVAYLGWGTGSSGTATVEGAGSNWNIAGQLIDGDAGTGSLTIESGGAVTAAATLLGGTSTGSGTLVLSGTGTALTDTGSAGVDYVGAAGLNVGFRGTGTLTIEDGAVLSNSMSYIKIGEFGGTTGTATITGAGSTLNAGGLLRVGDSGAGTLTVENGGQASVGQAQVGFYASSTGEIDVDAGSTLTTNAASTIDVGPQEGANGAVTVAAGSFDVGVQSGAHGAVDVDGGTLAVGGDLTVGDAGTGTLAIGSGGTVSMVATDVGSTATGTGTLTLTGTGTTLTDSGSAGVDDSDAAGLDVGINGTGTLLIESGAVLLNPTSYIRIGQYTAGIGTATVTGRGSTLSAGGLLRVGDSGTGSLTVESGGLVSAGQIQVGDGNLGSATGEIDVDDGGMVTTNAASTIDVGPQHGHFGAGTITVAAGSFDIGVQAGVTGTVKVDDGTLGVGGDLTVGDAGTGTLAISNGGTATSADGNVGTGGGTATVTIDGTGSQWTMTGQLTVGVLNAATGPSITLSNGADVTTSTAAATDYSSTYDRLRSGSSLTLTGSTFDNVWFWCETGSILSLGSGATMTLRGVGTTDSEWNLTVDGTATLDDATLNSATGPIAIGGNIGDVETGSLIASAGSQVTSLITRLAWGVGTTGTLTLTGAGTTWSDMATLGGPADSGSSYIGAFGEGALVIEAGATMSEAGAAYIGWGTGGSGTATVEGASSNWSIAGQLIDGDAETGSLTIESGSAVTAAATLLGVTATGNGTLALSGTGTALTDTGSAGVDYVGAAGLNVGFRGTGTLTIEDGAVLSNPMSYIKIGEFSGTMGTATVAGTGSTLSAGGLMRVGDSGTGALTVEGGGLASAGQVQVGFYASATGEIDVDAGSTLATNAASTIDVGPQEGEHGPVTVAAGSFDVGVQGGSHGTVDVDGGTLDVGGDLSIGDAGTGTLAVDASGTLAVSGTIDVGGQASGSGVLDVSGSGTSVTAVDLDVGGTASAAGGSGMVTIGSGADVTVMNANVWAGGEIEMAGGTLATDPITLASGGSITGYGTVTGALADDGTITAAGGVLDFTGTITNDGTLEEQDGGSLDFAGGVTGTGSLILADGQEVGTTFSQAVNFIGDTIDFPALPFKASYETIFYVSATGGTLEIVDTADNDAVVATLALTGEYSQQVFALASDGTPAAGTSVSFAGAPTLDAAPGDVVVSNVPDEPYSTYVILYNAGTYLGTDYLFAGQGQLSSYVYDYSAGNNLLASQFYYNSQSTPYTGDEYDYDGSGDVTRVDFTGVTGAEYSSYEYDFVGDVYAGAKFEVTSVPQGATYASYELDYDGNNNFVGDKFYFPNVSDQSYTTEEEDFDASGGLAKVLLSGFSSEPYSSLELDYLAGAYIGYKADYAVSGEPYATEEVDVNAENQLTRVIYSGLDPSNYPYSSVEEDYSGGAFAGSVYGFTGRTANFYAYQVTEDAAGDPLQETLDNNDGSHAILGLGPANQTFTSIGNDTMTGGGAGETFVFNAVYGHDTITDFASYMTGAGPDAISLPTSEFANMAAVIADAQNVGGNVVIAAPNGDTITFDNLSVGALSANQSDFTFHS